ncbi:hypothetical protein E7Z59_15055 [Robertkochia marina]|uniref:Arylsulfotransferase (ASST) n=1 Tax=Robertkochia marina TaxID=1227945 RepID=A0A4S3LXU1_9FLAO|nr:aryl-sulfate sulfotransferase [Robertkochia marina]THD65892.1 hypothetical protein E7Z59_15055 [Robertkochia marina]TRZ40857.1 hypothetical protein D3A96_14855 [Robertkochia marina]
MISSLRSRYFIVLLLSYVLVSCSDDEMPEVTEDPVEPPVENETPDEGGSDIEFGVLINNKSLKADDYVLVNDPGNNKVYLMDKDDASVVFDWALPQHLGNDAKLLDDGLLLVSMRAEEPAFKFGGYGGKLQLLDKNGAAMWNYDLSTENLVAHHDVILLPNGNVVTMLWERSDATLASSFGYAGEQPEIYTETLIEINPQTNEVVWRWDSRDHLVQDALPDGGNFGDIGESVRKININYKDEAIASIPDNGDVMHANGITYDEKNDLIYMSVNYYSEVWVIDHSTTTEEASGSTGGNYGVGGDLVYRFGNPSAYNNTMGQRYFYNNHTPRIIPETDHFLVYMNGNHTEGPSVVYELDLPDNLNLAPGADNEPSVVWEFSHPDMYSAKVSGAERLSNQNTLIAVGTFGYWEVTPEKEVVWQFRQEGFFWRGYPVSKGDPVLEILGVN